MKDSLIGIITVVILGVAVWTTQDKVYNYNPKQPIAETIQAVQGYINLFNLSIINF